MNLHTYTLLFISLLTVASFSCRKPTGSPAKPTSSAYHISYSLVARPGSPYYANYYRFAFASDAPAGSTMLWSFGDGPGSTAFAPTHNYFTPGVYTVTLTVNGDTAHTATLVIDVSRYLMPHTISHPVLCFKDSGIQFHTNVNPDSTFYWEFGDGSTSTETVPSHAYTATGTYTVRLKVNGNAATACSTTISVINYPSHTAEMGGTRTWHVYTFKYDPTDHNDLDYLPDETFAINIINPTQIQFNGLTLTYLASSTDSVLSFANNTGMTATYYRNHNSIDVSQFDSASYGGYTLERWMTP